MVEREALRVWKRDERHGGREGDRSRREPKRSDVEEGCGCRLRTVGVNNRTRYATEDLHYSVLASTTNEDDALYARERARRFVLLTYYYY